MNRGPDVARRESASPGSMRVIYMAKDKSSAIRGLRHLVDAGVEVVAVVAPEPKGAASAAPAPSLGDVARELGLPVTDDRALYARLAGAADAAPGVGPLTDIDLVLSFLFWKRIRRPLIELPRIGCINFHPAPLPDFRGLGGYNVAILEALPEWGVSAHFVDEDFDTGDVIRVDRFPIDPAAETAWSLEGRSQERLVALFERVVGTVREGKDVPRSPQGDGRYIDQDEFERMKRIGPDDPPDVIDRKIRAFWYPPYRGATIERGGQQYTLVNDALLQEIAAKYRG